MTREELLSEIADAADVGVNTIDEATPLKETNWSSMSAVMFIAAVDHGLEIQVEPNALAAAETVGDLVDLVRDKLADSGKAGGLNTVSDLLRKG